MASLSGRQVNNTFKGLLQIDNSNAGVDGTHRDIEDGEGTASGLQLSTAGPKVPSGKTLTIAGTIDVSSASWTGKVPVANGGTFAATAASARTNLGLGTADSPQFTAVNIGAASDTTLARSGAGDLTIEGNAIYRAGGTNVAIADGGTAADTAASARTNLGLGTADTVQFTALNIGHASDTTLSRSGAGDLQIETNVIYRAGGTNVAVADGGTAANTAASARTNLGLAIGTDVPSFSGSFAQVQHAGSSAVDTTSTAIPNDDSIPQITEGKEALTVSITPGNASNILIIEAVLFLSHNNSAGVGCAALFQDATANALTAAATDWPASNNPKQLILRHKMAAGTTSATTFRLRYGPASGSDTMTLNGFSGARKFGAIDKTTITVWEYRA